MVVTFIHFSFGSIPSSAKKLSLALCSRLTLDSTQGTTGTAMDQIQVRIIPGLCLNLCITSPVRFFCFALLHNDLEHIYLSTLFNGISEYCGFFSFTNLWSEKYGHSELAVNNTVNNFPIQRTS